MELHFGLEEWQSNHSGNIVIKAPLDVIDTFGQEYCIYNSLQGLIDSEYKEWFMMPKPFFTEKFKKVGA